jgi:hypothetical protein
MSTLNVLLTHLAAPEVEEHLELLRALAPRSRFATCHGGERVEFERLRDPEKTFVSDASLRGAARSFQAYGGILAAVEDRWLAAEPDTDAVYLFEFDHLILTPDFDDALRSLASATGAGLLGKSCGDRNATNWHHYTRFRRDAALLSHIGRISVREDPTRLFGTLASAMWLTRDAVASYLAVGEHPPCYGELYVPTLLHHLGYRVVDVDAVSDLYRHVRWQPEYTAGEAIRLRQEGAAFVHPIKDRQARRLALARS